MEEIPIEERTKHFKVPGINRFLLPSPTRKRVAYKGDTRVVYSSDIGGEERVRRRVIEGARKKMRPGPDVDNLVQNLKRIEQPIEWEVEAASHHRILYAKIIELVKECFPRDWQAPRKD